MKKIIPLFLFLTIVSQAQWLQVGNFPVWSFTSLGANLFAGSRHNQGKIFKSTDDGLTWSHSGNGLLNNNNNEVLSLVTFNNNIFAGMDNEEGIYLSTNNGTNWFAVNNGIPINNIDGVDALAVSGASIYAGTDYGGGVFRSTNNGSSWTLVNNGLGNVRVSSLAVSGNTLYAGTYGGGIFFTTNSGTNWQYLGLTNRNIRSLKASGSFIFAGTDTNGVFLSTNGGTDWSQTSLNDRTVFSLEVYGNNVFAATLNGIFVSNDNGATWNQRNEGLTDLDITSFGFINNYILTGAETIWRRNLAEIISVQLISTNVPKQFTLYQNYPNPFNPTTSISFDIATKESIKLILYDIVGHEVVTLVNQELNAGCYSVDWNANNYTSGIYFYKLMTRRFSDSKKMILIK